MLKFVNSDLHNIPRKSGSVVFYSTRWRTTIRRMFRDKSLCNGRNRSKNLLIANFQCSKLSYSLEMTIMVTFNPGTMKWPGPPEHVWSFLSIVYNKLFLHSRGQSVLQIVLKFGTNVYFCNCLDKVVGRMTSTISTLVRTRKSWLLGLKCTKGVYNRAKLLFNMVKKFGTYSVCPLFCSSFYSIFKRNNVFWIFII